ncbi:hypothetical protein MKX03_017939 [Papaver bracteatum]|nr:hypothetical protein MKX03_017939 [Papaver bracteatum]
MLTTHRDGIRFQTYATHEGFVMRVDCQSLRDGKIICSLLDSNKEGFLKGKHSRHRMKPRKLTSERSKAVIKVKQQKSGQWVVSKFAEEHNHPLVISSGSNLRDWLLTQTPVSSLNLPLS